MSDKEKTDNSPMQSVSSVTLGGINTVASAQPTNTFGRLLRRYRLAHGLDQEELGELLGLSRVTIGQWERTQLRHPLSPEQVQKLVITLGMDEAEILRSQGFQLRIAELELMRRFHMTSQEEELLTLFRPLSPEFRALVLRIIATLRPPRRRRDNSDDPPDQS